MPRRRPTDLERGAYELLRDWLIVGALILGASTLWWMSVGAATAWLAPTAVAGVAGGLCGVGYHLARGSRPRLATRLVTVAVVLAAAAAAWAAAVAAVIS